MILAWLWSNRRLVGFVMVAIFALAALGWFGHSRYAAGEAAGRAHVQTLWDAEAAAQRAAVAAAEARVRAKEAADRMAAQEIEDGLRTKLADSDALARDTARRLQDARARARGCAVPGATAPAGQPPSPGGEPGDAAALDRADEDHHAACARDAESLNAWVDWCDEVNCWAGTPTP